MFNSVLRRISIPALLIIYTTVNLYAQNANGTKFTSTNGIYTGIEVGSKGVKMSVVEIGKNAKSSGAFKIIKDTSVNTDFISFSPASFTATLNGLTSFYNTAVKNYNLPSANVFTVISSGVKMQAEKDEKTTWIKNLVDSFRLRINEPQKEVEVVDVEKEARLSHLGIIPENRRFNTFLFDIGSGNTKGGFFPGNDTKTFHLFQLDWGTKSVANLTEKRCGDQTGLPNYYKQLQRVLAGAENTDISYAVNTSGAYPLSDNIAVSGGIAWAMATLMHPELMNNSIVAVSLDEVRRFTEKIYTNPDAYTPAFLSANINRSTEKKIITDEVARVHKVFDQKALLAGSGLMLKVMRQFQSSFETKQFYLVKNGQVGWVSAYVDQSIKAKQ
jgi:hypothetical protein